MLGVHWDFQLLEVALEPLCNGNPWANQPNIYCTHSYNTNLNLFFKEKIKFVKWLCFSLEKEYLKFVDIIFEFTLNKSTRRKVKVLISFKAFNDAHLPFSPANFVSISY